MLSSMNNIGIGAQTGGNTLSQGKMAELGNNILTLPSMEKGRFLGTAKKKAVSLFQPEIKSSLARVAVDERGLVISLAADAFFKPASATLDVEASRATMLRVSELLSSPELIDPSTGKRRRARIEGHTDSTPVDPAGPWPSNWELSADRAINVLHFLEDLGVDSRFLQVTGLADTMPLVSGSESREAQAYNRRIDIVIVDDGLF
jgi:chemotaxis protein MotB